MGVYSPLYYLHFMNLTVTITTSGHLSTTLYENPQNLYLYIPPHSAHPSVMLAGNILRIHLLCSSLEDIKQKSSEFFMRLTQRGCTTKQLTPLFISAHQKASLYNPTTNPKKSSNADNKLSLHLQFLPKDPKPPAIHKLWDSIVTNPPGHQPLNQITNLHGQPITIKHLTIAYSQPLNLRNKFSIRNIVGRGRDVSSYMVESRALIPLLFPHTRGNDYIIPL